jgi:hypothetical protein
VAPTDNESETVATGARKSRGRPVSETEQLVSVLGALLTECERVRAMGEAAAGRLRHMISDLEGRSPREPAAPADSPVGDAPRKEPRTISTPGPSLQGIRLEKLEKSAPESSKVAIKHGLVVVGAVAFATLWALGIVAEVPPRPVTTTLYPEESTEIHEPGRPPVQAPSPAKPARVTGRTVGPAAAPSPQTSFTPVKPDTDLPPITAGFTSRGFFSRIGQARAAKEIIRSGPDVDQGAADGDRASRPSEPSPRRGPSPETP